MPTSRFVPYAILATLAVGAIAFAADALVVSDREKLEQLADELTTGEPAQRSEAVLRLVDPSREPVTVARGRSSDRFEAQDEHALVEEVGAALAPLAAPDLEVVQRSIRVEGERATLALRVRADGSIHDATLRLARSGQGWIVTELRVR